MRTNRPAYVAAEMNRIVADEEAFERLVDLFKQAHGRAPASDCEAYQWAAVYELAKIKHLLRNFFLQLDIWQTTCRFFAHSHLANLRHRLDDGSSIEPASQPLCLLLNMTVSPRSSQRASFDDLAALTSAHVPKTTRRVSCRQRLDEAADVARRL
jgi:hypothetical protein